MKNITNIEKSAFRKGEYVGYAGGIVFRIFKGDKSWVAVNGPYRLEGDTLSFLSIVLENFYPSKNQG